VAPPAERLPHRARCGGQGSFAFNTAGNREDTVNFMINGVNLNDQVAEPDHLPAVDQHGVRVQGRQLDPERRIRAQLGAVVNIATRSGSNNCDGEAFEFFRHQSLDARNSLTSDTVKQSPFKRNQFGANLGGPIVKNQTFFFLTYEGLRQRQALDFNSGV
jgi:hypothetical protein